ncbi:MAG: hypothetical protein ACXVCP_00425 [Bdellovibrio sp.]
MELAGFFLTSALSHPEMFKDFILFFMAWFLVKRGIEKNFDKITTSIEKLTTTMASLEENHNKRLTNLEIKVDQLIQPKSKED